MNRSGVRLSLAAIDVLWERLALGTPPAIFEIPSVGATLDERARIRDAVLADLALIDLVDRHGHLDLELTNSLNLLAKPPLAIEAVGVLRNGQRLCARAASNNRAAVLATLHDQALQLESIRPTSMISTMLELIGPGHSGPGRSVTYPATTSLERAARPTEGWAGGLLQQAYTPRTGHDAQREQARVILNQPRTQAGVFIVLARDTTHPEHERGTVLWFDTPAGRYLGYHTTEEDDQTWTTYTPADNARLTHHLSDLITIGRQ